MQWEEALGSDNRWYCAQGYGRKIDDEYALIVYFIKSGGAGEFAFRWDQAMSRENRYYCRKAVGHEVLDEVVLWRYYNAHRFDYRLHPAARTPEYACSA